MIQVEQDLVEREGAGTGFVQGEQRGWIDASQRYSLRELEVATRVGDTTWEDALRDPRVSVLIDRGRDWMELTGARVEGVAELMPAEHPDLRAPMSAWHDKYRTLLAGEGFERLAVAVPILGFLRVVPAVVATWDHRPQG